MTAAWRACSNCRRPAGCGATACARSARVTQERLDRLRDGVTIEGMHYGADRGDARPRAGRQCLAHLRDPRGQEPRGAQGAGVARAAGEPADPGRRSGRSSWASSPMARSRKCATDESARAARAGRSREQAEADFEAPIWSDESSAVIRGARKRAEARAGAAHPARRSASAAHARTTRRSSQRPRSQPKKHGRTTTARGGPRPSKTEADVMRVVGGTLALAPDRRAEIAKACARPPTGCARRCSTS